jgi:hypothetical protein
MEILAAPQASYAGLVTAFSTLLLAVGGIITALTLFIPILRGTRKNTESLKRQDSKLEVIHTLVNSTLTAALQSELDATRREEMYLRDNMALRLRGGEETSDDQRAMLGAVQRRITELSGAMRERAQQTRAADIQIQTERDREDRLAGGR